MLKHRTILGDVSCQPGQLCFESGWWQIERRHRFIPSSRMKQTSLQGGFGVHNGFQHILTNEVNNRHPILYGPLEDFRMLVGLLIEQPDPDSLHVGARRAQFGQKVVDDVFPAQDIVDPSPGRGRPKPVEWARPAIKHKTLQDGGQVKRSGVALYLCITAQRVKEQPGA